MHIAIHSIGQTLQPKSQRRSDAHVKMAITVIQNLRAQLDVTKVKRSDYF